MRSVYVLECGESRIDGSECVVYELLSQLFFFFVFFPKCGQCGSIYHRYIDTYGVLLPVVYCAPMILDIGFILMSVIDDAQCVGGTCYYVGGTILERCTQH